jgi:hypothetical protein
MRARHYGGAGRGPEMSPEDIFNAFFGGGMPGGGGGPMGGGGGGVHFYSTGFGPGMHFRTGGGGMPRRRAAPGQGPAAAAAEQNQTSPGLGMLMQLLPVLFFILLSFMSQSDNATASMGASRRMPGEDQYFSLTVSTVAVCTRAVDASAPIAILNSSFVLCRIRFHSQMPWQPN